MNTKSIIIAVSIIGLILSVLVFGATFVNQKAIANSAKEFIVSKAKDKYAEYQSKIASIPSSEKTLEFLKGKYQEKFDSVSGESAQFEKIITDYIDFFCKNKKCNLEQEQNAEDLKKSFLSIYERSLKNTVTQAILNIDDVLKNKTQEVLASILADLRIFSGTNLAIFTFILLTTVFAKSELLKSLRLPTALLTLSSLIAIFVYIFEQNWFYTILYSNYWGAGYIALVLFIFILLFDIVMNKARITEAILNFFGSVISSPV